MRKSRVKSPYCTHFTRVGAARYVLCDNIIKISGISCSRVKPIDFVLVVNRSIENDHDEENEKLKNSFDQKVTLTVMCANFWL